MSATSLGASGSLTDALSGGKVSLNVRARYEHAEQDGLDDSNAVTIRPRLAYTTGAWDGWQAMLEFENTTALDGDAYNQAGTNPGGAGRVVVADPVGTEVNQAWVSWKRDGLLAKAGRQRLVLDNARFVGDVAWRQNMQTFDAVSLTGNPADALTLNYEYLWRINRVFGTAHPQGHWESDSHLLNAAFAVAPSVTITTYGYLLDFDQSAPNSSATYGISLVGARVLDQARGSRLTYRLEYAHQQDHADQPLDYAADYQCIEVGYAHGKINGGAAIEILGSDGGAKGFATPLATLHAFNGWADVFLNTPARGLRDVYAWLGGTAPGGVNLRLVYHDFRSDSDSATYGDEWDLQAAKSIGKNWSLLAKFAGFSGAGDIPDVTRYWAQAEFAF